MAEELKTG